MKKHFDPAQIEEKLYNFWEVNNYFKPDLKYKKSNFCIILPPPNITGDLHIGHAFQYTIMDILIRYNRMKGKNTFWQVGTDHAGIATQIVLEKKILLEDKKTLKECGKKNFIKKAWKWKEKLSKNITNQMRRLGMSVDWSKEKFTLDSEMSYAVREAFIVLYNQKLIYKRKKLVNWDPILKTVVSDLEVKHCDSKNSMWYIKYFIINDDTNLTHNVQQHKYLIVATTRPETLFGDTAIAVHPEDMRYSTLIGKKVLVPLINRVIPIIGDNFVKMKKGTGCVKITPAHDFNDFDVSLRHNLPMINVFTEDGNISHIAKEYNINGEPSFLYSEEIPIRFQNLNRFVAREKILKELIKNQQLDKTEIQNVTLAYGDRSNSIIEPFLTDQWYLNVSLLAKQASKVVQDGYISFIPKKYEKIYFSWMKNVKDWCISRQLWWGHQIPIWYDLHHNIYVGHNECEIRKKYMLPNNIKLKQDKNVLDTWFSSGLWVFASLGWPKKTKILNMFYPTNIIVSGFDIIFFWISRMIMLSIHFIKDTNIFSKVPFKIAYITGLICDENGKKMSKSKGNVIDPLDIIDGITLENLIKKRTKNMLQPSLKNQILKNTTKTFPNGIDATGVDALRFTCSSLSNQTKYINWNLHRLYICRNFCNKLWNASRFVLLNLNKELLMQGKKVILSTTDKWIMLKLNITIKKYRIALDTYRFDIASSILHEFIWKTFCDFYIELVKSFITSCSKLELIGTQRTMLYVLESILRLAHPIIPFITEEIWQKVRIFLDIKKNTNSIILRPFPKYKERLKNKSILKDMKWIRDVFLIVRQHRMNVKLSYKESISIYFKNINLEVQKMIEKYKEYLKNVLYLKSITIFSGKKNKSLFSTYLIRETEILIPISKKFLREIELRKVEKEILKVSLKIDQLQLRLSNQKFLDNASFEIIKNTRNRLVQFQLIHNQLSLKKKMLF
ncbi:MAG: valine--tRNA ligase [Buchnera aphidicola (Nurudea shiraii)]